MKNSKNPREPGERPVSRVRFAAGILFATAALVSGCVKPAAKAPVSLGEEVVRSLGIGRAELRSVRSVAKAEFRKKGRKFRFRASILAEFPDRLFVEAAGFGIPACLLSVRGDNVRIFIPAKEKYFEGRASDGLESVFGVKLPAERWIRLLLGYAPVLEKVLEVVQSGEDWKISGIDQGERVHLTVDQHSGWLKRFDLLGHRQSIVFGEPLPTPDGGFPSSIRISTSEAALDLEFEEVVPNPKIPEESFDLRLPPRIKAVPLTRGQAVIEEGGR